MYKCFAYTQQSVDFTSSIPCLAHSHRCQQRKLFHHKLYTLPESTSLISIKRSQNQIPVLSSLSFSLEFLYSSLARYQAQRKVLAFSQALLANRTSHHYVSKWPVYCLWFFPIYWCLCKKILYFKFNKFVWFQLVNIKIDTRFSSKLISVTNNIVLLSNTYCIL
jgi:hypothetical protein